MNCAILFFLHYHLGWGLQKWFPKVSMVKSSLMRIHGFRLTIVCSCLLHRESIKTVDMTAAYWPWYRVSCQSLCEHLLPGQSKDWNQIFLETKKVKQFWWLTCHFGIKWNTDPEKMWSAPHTFEWIVEFSQPGKTIVWPKVPKKRLYPIYMYLLVDRDSHCGQ